MTIEEIVLQLRKMEAEQAQSNHSPTLYQACILCGFNPGQLANELEKLYYGQTQEIDGNPRN